MKKERKVNIMPGTLDINFKFAAECMVKDAIKRNIAGLRTGSDNKENV